MVLHTLTAEDLPVGERLPDEPEFPHGAHPVPFAPSEAGG